MRHFKSFLSILLIAAAFLGFERIAAAQIPFEITEQSGSSSQTISNGATVNLAANAVGQSTQLTLTLTYDGTSTVTLGTPQVFGSPAFTAFLAPASSSNLTPGQSATYAIVYTAASSSLASASVTIPFAQGGGQSGTISLNVTGSAPSFVIGYAIQPQGNAVPVSNGSTITFPATQVGGSSTALLTIQNTGSAPGTLSSLTLTGAAFSTLSLPLLPATIGSGQAFQIALVYSPQASEADSGTLQLVFPGQTVTLNLAGTGVSSQLSFQFSQGTQALAVNQNQVSLADTPVGTPTAVSVTVVDTGNANAVINGINLTGAGCQLASVPPLPQTLAPKASLTLTFTFTPPQAGSFTCYLTMGGSTLTITARGLGPLFQYSFTTGSSPTPVSANGTIYFPTAQVGQSTSTTFTITNAGTASGTISGIYIGEANSPFTITGLPQFPLTLAPNQSVSFGITFAPSTVAAVTGTLHIDGTQIFLNGAGGTPPAFPGYSFNAPQGTLGPLQQPAISLNLTAPYPLAVTGTLTMTVIPNGFSADPAIQFSTGGRTVAFSIPANTTAAVFPNGSTSIELQTGSTSGTITLTPTFATASGVALTPASSQNLQLSVPPAAPLLIGAQVGAASATGLSLAISGVTNSQTLTQLNFNFTAATNFNLAGATVSVSLGTQAAAWFQSAAAQAFGGQFVATIPFSFTTSTTSVTQPVTAVSSVTITATNAQGTSSPIKVTLP